MTLNTSLQGTATYIRELQTPSGALPWFEGGIVDPWDHVEAAMGLSVAGEVDGARRAFEWLAHQQREDGGWYAAYQENSAADRSRTETNFVAYVATGIWHLYLADGKRSDLVAFWPMVERAIDYVLNQQAPEGEIYWAVDSVKGVSQDALVTGCSSIYKSIQCALNMANVLGLARPRWQAGQRMLGEAILHKPSRFDRTWESKQRYSMDWFYPILGGLVQGDAAKARLLEKWDTFVEPNLGCRCVSDQPWVTVAETCELIMACVAADMRVQAITLFDCIQQFQLADGRWWTGYVFSDQVYWPDEHPSWTAAAVLLAADTLYQITPAHALFTSADAVAPPKTAARV